MIWCGLALAVYTSGLGFLANPPATPLERQHWPLFLLLAPIALALILDVGEYRESGLLLSAVVLLWGLRCLRHFLWSPRPDLRRSVAGLTAGVVFVDWLATCPLNLPNALASGARQLSLAFLVLFGLTLILQELDRRIELSRPAFDPRSSPLPSRDF